jgi:uncharacterized protein YndB with AHSA1/START domain
VQDIEIRADLPVPPEAVWEVLADHEGYARWAGVKEVVVRHPGDPAPNGVGAIRVLRARGVAIEEEITGFDPPKRMTYALTAGMPVREYEAEILLEPHGAGTALTWRVRLRPSIPGSGWLLRRLTRRAISDLVERLTRHLS